MNTWNVYVERNGRSHYLGEVDESTEELARCAALSKFAIDDDEMWEMLFGKQAREGIFSNDEFSVLVAP